MTDILLRDVPQKTVDALKQRAKQNRRSLQEELLSILEAATQESQARSRSRVAAAIRTKLAQGGRTFGDSAELVREGREFSRMKVNGAHSCGRRRTYAGRGDRI